MPKKVQEPQFECEFCGQTFVTESRFMRHKCKWMEREEQFRDLFGQSGWHIYQEWMRAKHRMPSSPKTFLRSKYFGSFYRFAQFVKKHSIPDTGIFIRLMVRLDIQPALWSSNQSYTTYIQHMDLRVDPNRQAKITVDTILDIVDAAKTEPSDFFNILTPTELFHLIRARKLSPWILLNSSKFKNWIASLSNDQHNILLVIINTKFWKKQFVEKPKIVNLMKIYVKELNL